MKRTEPDTPTTPRELKRIKVELIEAERRVDRAKHELMESLVLERTLNREDDNHPESKAARAIMDPVLMRRDLPGTLFRILVEEGDVKHGKLLSFHTGYRAIERPPPSFEIEMTFSISGEHKFLLENCNRDVTSDDDDSRIEGVIKPADTARCISDLWKRALAVNDQEAPRALASLAAVGYDRKRSDVCFGIMAGLQTINDE